MDQTQDYYSALQLELARQGWDYYILDSHYLRKAAVSGPRLELAGEQLRALILPPMTHIADASAAQIRRFADAGGLILELGPQPPALDGVPMRRFPIRAHTLFMDNLDYAVQIQVPEPVRADLAPLLEVLCAYQPPEVEILSGSRDHLFFSRRFTANGEWYWAVNDTPQARRVTVRFPSEGVFEKWDAETGERFALPAKGPVVTLEFGPWDAYFVMRHAGPATAPPAGAGARQVLLRLPDSGWQFTPEAPVRVPYAKLEGSTEPIWLAPERLANRNWWLAGPYPDNDGQGFFDPYPPERGFNPKDPAWRWHESPTAAVRPPSGDGVYYASVNVWSPAARRAQAAVAVGDSVKLWWNSELKFVFHFHPPFTLLRDAWAHRPPVELRQGWSSVLLKIGVELNASGATGFLFRMADEEGNTLRDVVYTRDRVLAAHAPKRVYLTVDAPPGTEGKPLRLDITEDAIPERPIAFAPRTTPFTLASWTDSALANYSGSALYETGFDLAKLPAGERLVLDLGKVGLAAEVWVNDQKAGERAWQPFEIDFTPHARRGANRLRIRVANSNAGWMAQGDPIYERGAWGVNFASERDRLRTLRPNGLEGLVCILAR